MSSRLGVDGFEDLFPIVRNLPERFFFIKHAEPGGSREIISINDQLNPVVQIRPGQMQFWRTANIGATLLVKFKIEGMPLYVMATDGHPRSRPERTTGFFAGPGQRIPPKMPKPTNAPPSPPSRARVAGVQQADGRALSGPYAGSCPTRAFAPWSSASRPPSCDRATKRMKPMSTAQCVSEALRAFRRKRSLSLPGSVNRVLSAIIPASIMRVMMGKMIEQTLASRTRKDLQARA